MPPRWRPFRMACACLLAGGGVLGRADGERGYLARTYEAVMSAGPDALALVQTTHAYWLLGALHLAGDDSGASLSDEAGVHALVRQRRNPDGGFGATPGDSSSALHTLAALQIGALLGRLDTFRGDGELVAYARSQLAAADSADGGCDARQLCCSVLALRLLRSLPAAGSAETHALRDAILRCRNWDGAFGGAPLAESHAGTTFCCVAALGALGELGALAQPERTARWLAERQQPSGGFNGRADKAADLCYSWWCAASLALLGRLRWVDAGAALRFIDSCAHAEGGFAHAPGEPPDPYHTFFGLAARALLLDAAGLDGRRPEEDRGMECAFALPRRVVPRECRLREGCR